MRKQIVLQSFIVDFVFFCISIILIISSQSPNILAILIVFFSVYMLFKVRKNSYLMILFGIILYINISTVISEVLSIATALGPETLLWQKTIRESSNWLDGASSLVIMLATLNLFINKSLLRVDAREYTVDIKDNPIVFYSGYLLLWVIWAFFSYSTGGELGDYTSNTNPLYEYCIIITPIVWTYSNNEKKKKVLVSLFVFAYCIKALLHGDRSSMIPMLLVLYFVLLSNFNLKLWQVVLLALVGIVSANVINVIRIYSYSNIDGLISTYTSKYGASLLTSDTVSQSYYTSVVTQMTANDIGGGYVYFLDFLGAIVFGGSFGNGNVSNIVVEHYPNKFGGFFYSWPYFWFGYVGVFIFSVILGLTLHYAFKRSSQYSNMMKIIIVVFSFRWYLYTCFDFFRGVLFISSVVYFALYCFSRLCNVKIKM